MHFPYDENIVTIDQISFTNNCTTFSHPISLSVPNVQVLSPPPQVYYVATCPIELVSMENNTLLLCSSLVDLVLEIDLVTPSMGALDFDLPPIDPSECSSQYVVLPLEEDIL